FPSAVGQDLVGNRVSRSVADLERARSELKPVFLALRACEFDGRGVGIKRSNKSRIRRDKRLSGRRILIRNPQDAGPKGGIVQDRVRRSQSRSRRDRFGIGSGVAGIRRRSRATGLTEGRRKRAEHSDDARAQQGPAEMTGKRAGSGEQGTPPVLRGIDYILSRR